MTAFRIALLATAVAVPAFAVAQQMDHSTMPMPGMVAEEAEAAPPRTPAADPIAGHDMSSMGGMPGAEREMPNAPPPPAALSGPAHAADLVYGPLDMAEAREGLREDQGELRAYMVMVDQLEARMRGGDDGYLWDAQGWYGGDLNKLWIKTEGEGTFSEMPEDAEVQALWSRAITPWFDFQAGVRYDFLPDDADRSHLVVGLQGLVPYFFEIDAAAFLSDEGDVTARFEAEYDQLITQKLILQPRVEFELAAQDIPELDIGRGVSSLKTELRLRYEFVPEFAPYIGVGYERQMGKTADFVRAAGEDVGEWSALVGVRTWF